MSSGVTADEKKETGTLVLPHEPCVLATLGAMRETLEDERADCLEELSTIDNPFTTLA